MLVVGIWCECDSFLLKLLLHHAPIGWPIVLVLFLFGTPEEAVFKGVPLFPSVISVCRGHDCPRQRLLAVWTFFVRRRTFLPPRRGLWAWYEMGWGCQILWPHNSPFKSCCPAPRTERRVLLSSSPRHGLSSPILRQCQSLFACLRRVSGASIYGASSLNSGGSVLPTLDGVMVIQRWGFL